MAPKSEYKYEEKKLHSFILISGLMQHYLIMQTTVCSERQEKMALRLGFFYLCLYPLRPQ